MTQITAAGRGASEPLGGVTLGHQQLEEIERILLPVINRLVAQCYALLHQQLEYKAKQDPQRYHDFGTAVAGGDLELARREMRAAEELFDRKRATSPLPEHPDREVVARWLYRVRYEQALLATA